MNQNIQSSNNNSLGRLILGAFVLYAIKDIFSAGSDTVVYYLYKGNKICYIGITYEDRIEKRIQEHACKGWNFDTYDCTGVMSRAAAGEKERKLIARHRPKYNIHHNC